MISLKWILSTLLAISLGLHALSAAEETPAKDIYPTFADVAYGPAPLQKLDFWQAKSEKPAPLLVIIHGGGWIAGDKKAQFDSNRRFFDRGISIACINYRLAPSNPLPAPVMDAVRAVQFLRSKAVEWNIDPNRIIAMGNSAGGCSSLWLATHDDLANPNAVDPVERQSSRLSGAVALNAQTSIEPDKIREWIGERVLKHGMIRSAGGFKTDEEMAQAIAKKTEVARLYREFSPINHLSTDDPPILLTYGTPLSDTKEGIHHSLFGLKFKEKADGLGINNCYFHIQNDDKYSGFSGGIDKFIETLFRK